MGFETSTMRGENYLLFVVAGPVTKENIVELGHRIRVDCKASKVESSIVDCKAMEGALPPGQLYYATQAFISALGPIRVAYINPPPQWIPADDKFSRDVAQNHGGMLALFPSELEAAEWLRTELKSSVPSES